MKYSIDTIKDLKIKVKELDTDLLKYYTPDEFKPDQSFPNETADTESIEIPTNLVEEMIMEFVRTNSEFDAGKKLFEKLKLTPRQASDIGFWTYHNHHTFYKYISKRWSDLWKKDNTGLNRSSFVVNHWIQSNSSQGELIDYPISGLWWSFYLTVDDEREDKYELTKVFFKNLSMRTKLLGTAKFARHKPAILGVLEFIKENNLDDNSLEQAARAIVPYINLLGGIRPLAYFQKEWFKQKLTNRFGEQIRNGKPLFLRPDKIKANQLEDNPIKKIYEKLFGEYKPDEYTPRYFCLNGKSGNYIISHDFHAEYDFNICFVNFDANQFLIHFYKEGKIKKTKIVGGISTKSVDRPKPYSNGKCHHLSLIDVQIINDPVLFGIAYKINNSIFFKAMDEQIESNFRSDNASLNQEGKKVLYLDDPFIISYKILPYKLKGLLGSLIQKSPTSRGANINNTYYSDQWEILRKHWPELFDGTINW